MNIFTLRLSLKFWNGSRKGGESFSVNDTGDNFEGLGTSIFNRFSVSNGLLGDWRSECRDKTVVSLSQR